MKLDYYQRQEVNRLIEAAQDDLEAVLFELVGQRDAAVEALQKLRSHLRDTGHRQSEMQPDTVVDLTGIIDDALEKIGT